MPKASIDGTQRPINMAAVASPLKYSISEKMSERNAEINNSLSVVVNFCNMMLLVFLLMKHFYRILLWLYTQLLYFLLLVFPGGCEAFKKLVQQIFC